MKHIKDVAEAAINAMRTVADNLENIKDELPNSLQCNIHELRTTAASLEIELES